VLAVLQGSAREAFSPALKPDRLTSQRSSKVSKSTLGIDGQPTVVSDWLHWVLRRLDRPQVAGGDFAKVALDSALTTCDGIATDL
jgi:hypothetical protein